MTEPELTAEQVEVVCAPPNELLAVTAVAGSGKTTALTFRANALVASGIEPTRILVLTFTRAAAAVARMRIHAVTPGVEVTTVHGLCLMLLQRHAPALFDRGLLPTPSFSVATDQELMRERREVAKQTGRGVGSDRVMEVARRNLYGAGLLPMDELLRRGADALGLRAVDGRPLLAVPWTHVLVDEAQDLSEEQWGVVRALGLVHGAVATVVGDEAQSIYQWLGATPERFREALRQWDRTLELTKNWRSRPEICALANRVLDAMPGTTTPHLVSATEPERDPEAVQVYAFPDEQSELSSAAETAAELGKDRSVALLARYREQVTALARLLGGHGTSFWMPGATQGIWSGPSGEVGVAALRAVYERRDGDLVRLLRASMEEPPTDLLEDIRAKALDRECAQIEVLWEDHHMDPRLTGQVWWPAVAREFGGDGCSGDVEAAVHALGLPQEMQLSAAVWCRERGDGRHSVSDFLRALPLMGADDDVPLANLCLSTIHGAKGGEWDAVILTGLVEGRLPGRERGVDEERRLFYVAVTRARELLVLTHHGMGESPDGRSVRRYPSRFLREVGLGLVEEKRLI